MLISSFLIFYENDIKKAPKGLHKTLGGFIGAFSGDSASQVSPDGHLTEKI